MQRVKDAFKSLYLMMLCVILCSFAMIWGFDHFNAYNQTVLNGAILGTSCRLINLFLIQIGLQFAQEEADKEELSGFKRDVFLKTSDRFRRERMLVMIPCLCFGLTMPTFNKAAALLPFIFPRICAVFFHSGLPLWTTLYGKIKNHSSQKSDD